MKKRLEYLFVTIMVLALLLLAKNYYDDYKFKHNEIPKSYKDRIYNKKQEIMAKMKREYGYSIDVPIVVTDKFKNRLYGLTSYNSGSITIYLNKNIMRESIDYMVESVIAHEYAHALMFKRGYVDVEHNGHSNEWRSTCNKLGGLNCSQYVNSKDVIMGKLPF